MLDHRQIAQAFNNCFQSEHCVRLVGGGSEPLYTPSRGAGPGQLLYREDFPASALHEAAHWCIASRERRGMVDFGYEYILQPRTTEQQQAFFRLELKVQSLESRFADAAGLKFQVSADNLTADVSQFEREVCRYRTQTQAWLDTTSGCRAKAFIAALERCWLEVVPPLEYPWTK